MKPTQQDIHSFAYDLQDLDHECQAPKMGPKTGGQGASLVNVVNANQH